MDTMIDLHTHTLLSDGVLIASELARRAEVRGYEALGITDHVDASNIEAVTSRLLRFVEEFKGSGGPGGFRVVVGVEITHVAPARIGAMVDEARARGARLVVCHGETPAEPVAPGTNRAAIEAGVDILAHPGLITEDDARLAARRGVSLEITSRKGHSITNGHVARMAELTGALIVINTDAHEPSDLITDEYAWVVAQGACMSKERFDAARANSRRLLEKAL